MARGSLLNDIDKGKISAFSDAELNRTEIARKIGCSGNVVANFLRVPEWGKANKAGGQEKRRITMVVSNNTASLNEIRSAYCSTVSKATVLEGTKDKAIHQAGKEEEVSHFNSRSQESRDGLCPYTSIVDFGVDWVILPFPMCMCLFSTSFILFKSIFNDERKCNLDGLKEDFKNTFLEESNKIDPAIFKNLPAGTADHIFHVISKMGRVSSLAK
uniref:HTH_Tnp_Tc3_1 domain-containing protein n=1 Tax=Heterorhabditis bacteriophora TaxID=37862 RepID=A0A1I7WFU8_HETBA